MREPGARRAARAARRGVGEVVAERDDDDDDAAAGAAAAAPVNPLTTSGAGGGDIVTSVKLSPTAKLCLLGHSRGGDGSNADGIARVVSVVYRVSDMVHVTTERAVGDDVNIARFHPRPGSGVIYGTKQGKICKMTPRDEPEPMDAS